jgi:hypothetical protein
MCSLALVNSTSVVMHFELACHCSELQIPLIDLVEGWESRTLPLRQ